MFFYQNTNKSPYQPRNDILSNNQTKKNFHAIGNIQKAEKYETNTCFCFRSSKDHNHKKVQNVKIQTSPNDGLKEQALRLSRQIASQNFKHLKNVGSSPKDSFSQNNTFETTKVSSQKIQKLQSGQKSSQNSFKKEQKIIHSQKDEFNMSRITFSAINRSYQKTVNNTVSSNNTSVSFDTNILGSVVSQVRNNSERLKSQQQVPDESFSLISSVNKKKNYDSMKSQLKSKKAIKVLKTKPQIEPIKEENEEIETKKYKFIRVKTKNLLPKPINSKGVQKLDIKMVETEEKLASSKELEDLEIVKYDYSSIVIDFFNMDLQTLEKIEEEKRKQISQNVQSEVTVHNNPRKSHVKALSFTPQVSAISKQTSFCSSASYNPVQSISTSNIRSIFASHNLSSDSNIPPMSINNNLSQCSFDSIPRKEVKRGYVGFDGLSCINENEQSEIEGKNQSDQCEAYGIQALNY